MVEKKVLVEKIFGLSKIFGPSPHLMVQKRIHWAKNIISGPKTGNLGSKHLPGPQTTHPPLALPSRSPTYSFVPPGPPTQYPPPLCTVHLPLHTFSLTHRPPLPTSRPPCLPSHPCPTLPCPPPCLFPFPPTTTPSPYLLASSVTDNGWLLLESTRKIIEINRFNKIFAALDGIIEFNKVNRLYFFPSTREECPAQIFFPWPSHDKI